MPQGLGTSGTDTALRSVFSRVTAIGVRTVASKAPNETEPARDFLWRIH